jgi:tRNA pseudouridine55 synthase
VSLDNGLVVVDKSGGMTSHDVVARVRSSTTTDDAEGERVEARSTDGVTEELVLQALSAFVGVVDQVPSAVSAIKVDGRRAYERVRAGETVELPSRQVRIDSIEVHSVVAATGTDLPQLDVRISVRCSSGTYIRAIARDLGERLEVGGHLTALRRTAVGPYALDAAHTLDELGEDFTLLPIADAARQAFPALDLDEEQATDVGFGRTLPIELEHQGPVALFAPDGTFLALYEQDVDAAEPVARAVAVFT